jgi:uncharacterized protein (DUF2062 family)
MGISELIRDLEPILPPFIIGSVFLGLVCGVTGYALIYYAVVRQRKLGRPR